MEVGRILDGNRKTIRLKLKEYWMEAGIIYTEEYGVEVGRILGGSWKNTRWVEIGKMLGGS